MKLSTQGSGARQTNADKHMANGSPGRIISFFLLSLATLLAVQASAQNLFTYGKHAVTKEEFLNAYLKNNSDSAARMPMAEYLELYLRFKLKVQAATDARLDTSSTHQSEMKSFRLQLADAYLKEDASVELLVDEAARRALKDIHLSHIFIPADKSAPADDISHAQQDITAIYERLQKGEEFNTAGGSYKHSDIGYVTVFTLPYAFENIVYSTPPGKFSIPFQSSAGFHIVRYNHERQALGKIRVAQILVAFPPDAGEQQKKSVAKRADSIYSALMSGADFSSLATSLSDDHLSYQTGGELPAFGVGQYDTTFEYTAFSLEKDGDISLPFKTSFGYHIIKRLQRIPVVTDTTNKDWKNVLRERVTQSDRMQVAQSMLISSIREKIKKDAPPPVLASDSTVMEYYRDHLENYNRDFGIQMNEFREGNLLFGIMQQKVWDAATTDSAGLKRFYEENREKYKWENSADAIIVTCLDAMMTENTIASLQKNHHAWRSIVDQSNGVIQADSARFDLSQIPIRERTNFTAGLITAPVQNEQDSSETFAYVIRLYPPNEPKKFEDAKGAVINDYQMYLEEKWIAELKKKYPVKINRKVFDRLTKG